jgi:hypothetical protein
MRTLWVLATLWFGISLPACGVQAATPEAALEEIATAEKPEAIVRHLPQPVQKSIDELPNVQKQQVLDKLLTMKSEHLNGWTLRRSSDIDGWDLADEDGESQGKVKVANVFVSGLDALVSLQFQSKTDADQVMFMVAMHLEDHDWRINDFGQWMKSDLHLAQLAHQPTKIEKNEAAAQENLRKVLVSLLSYGADYPGIGFPSHLAVLTGRGEPKPSEEHAGLLEAAFAADPVIISGYQFRYTLTRPGGAILVRSTGSVEGAPATMFDMGAFQIVATPLEFGKSGIRSFFTDSTGRMTATSEDRPATTDDPALSETESGFVFED